MEIVLNPNAVKRLGGNVRNHFCEFNLVVISILDSLEFDKCFPLKAQFRTSISKANHVS